MSQVIGQPGFWQALWYGRSLDGRLRLPSAARGGDEGKEEECGAGFHGLFFSFPQKFELMGCAFIVRLVTIAPLTIGFIGRI
ncbi:MAG: hypothetical protein O2874_08220 [Verrucomicrobia bacterium]|nr:hypothetical protein [Verrucomicrobiota bacterium]